MINKTTAVPVSNCRKSFAEALRVSELHRDQKFSGLVDITPLAWVLNQTDVLNPRFTDVDRRQAFGEIVDNIELCFKDNTTGGVDEDLPAVALDERQSFDKTCGTVELRPDHNFAGAVDESRLPVLLDEK